MTAAQDIDYNRTPWADPEHDVMADLRDAMRWRTEPLQDGDLAMPKAEPQMTRCAGRCKSRTTKRIVAIQQTVYSVEGQRLGQEIVMHDVDVCVDAALYVSEHPEVKVFEGSA